VCTTTHLLRHYYWKTHKYTHIQFNSQVITEKMNDIVTRKTKQRACTTVFCQHHITHTHTHTHCDKQFNWHPRTHNIFHTGSVKANHYILETHFIKNNYFKTQQWKNVETRYWKITFGVWTVFRNVQSFNCHFSQARISLLLKQVQNNGTSYRGHPFHKRNYTRIHSTT
jgi:hypothetical protein